MEPHPLTKLWPLIYSVIQEIWAITEPEIEEAAIRNDIPIDLYYYGELGLEYFSVVGFQKRDPFSNPEQFEKLFARLNVQGWIEPNPDDRYRVTEKARKGARLIIEAGDAHLPSPESMPEIDLERLQVLIKQIVLANDIAPEPPEKSAILKRYRVADQKSPVMVKIREYLMDLFAYRDDSHLSAAKPHFNQAGIVWNVLGAVWSGSASTAEKMAEIMAFRGYEADEYEVALQAAAEIGWLAETETTGAFRITEKGREVREKVEALTDEYFFLPWAVLTPEEIEELDGLLTKLRERFRKFRKLK